MCRTPQQRQPVPDHSARIYVCRIDASLDCCNRNRSNCRFRGRSLEDLPINCFYTIIVARDTAIGAADQETNPAWAGSLLLWPATWRRKMASDVALQNSLDGRQRTVELVTEGAAAAADEAAAVRALGLKLVGRTARGVSPPVWLCHFLSEPPQLTAADVFDVFTEAAKAAPILPSVSLVDTSCASSCRRTGRK